jgi:MinD-like ATPase involved in chromosome partitioning or flagellar assembly
LTAYQPPSLRLALGLGDQELEQRLRPALEAADDLTVVAQCLAADQLLQVADSRQADALVVAWSLHRLTDGLLEQLERPELLVLLLVPDPGDARWRNRRGPVLGMDTDPATLRDALVSARAGGRPIIRRPTPEPVPLKPADRTDTVSGTVIAVAGGAGSPGRTTVAINLATALGAARPTLLVELDMCTPSIAAYLDADPSRNLCTLAHAVREDPHTWGAALADELQPLSGSGGSVLVLCGPPKREMRSTVGPGVVERLLGEAAHRYRWIVVDVGPDLLGMDTAAAVHRAALLSAQQVLLVAAADLVGLWHARVALDQVERQLGIERRAIHLVLNRYDARYHHAQSEVEWHLGAPVAAVVPFDHAAIQRAIVDQRPVVVDSTSRAGRALLALAERLNRGKLRVPVETAGHARRHSWWGRLLSRRVGPTPRRSLLEPERIPIRVAPARGGREW